jgi:hypothetical protein
MTGEADSKKKFDYFLTHFKEFFLNISDEKYKKEYNHEYSIVINGYFVLNQSLGQKKTLTSTTIVEHYPNIGLVSVITPEPLHYYSLFSVSLGYDIVMACYSGNRYEVEIKYTLHADLISRPTLPKVEMHKLAKYLNEVEAQLRKDKQINEESNTIWTANSFTDSGPSLRIDDISEKASKIDRYASPFERIILSSFIDPNFFQSIVISYFTYAYESTKVVKKIDWFWPEYHEFNALIDWKEWKPPALLLPPIVNDQSLSVVG